MPDENPLTEVDPLSISELFARDPLDLTQTDLEKMVEYYRINRAKWATEESSAVKEGRRARPKKAKVTLGDVKLDDLDLGMGGES